MNPTDATAQQHVITARAAAGLSDPADMWREMDEARAAMSAQIDKAMTDTQAARDFSAANDAALTGIADQGDDFDAYMRQLCTDRPDGIIEHYNSATEGHP